jgi:hypothetical protein
MDLQRLLEHIRRRLEGNPQDPRLLAPLKERTRPDGVVTPRSSVGDIRLHARCTSFYPSISPRAACLFSLALHVFSALSFQPARKQGRDSFCLTGTTPTGSSAYLMLHSSEGAARATLLYRQWSGSLCVARLRDEPCVPGRDLFLNPGRPIRCIAFRNRISPT